MARPILSVTMQGLDPFLKQLRRVEKASTQRRILKSSLNAGAAPVKTSMRRAIRAEGAIRTRATYKAVTSQVRAYPSGNAVLIVGVKDKKTADGVNPGNIFHLIDMGTEPHGQSLTPIPEIYEGGWIMRGRSSYQHPGAKPKPIREPALNTSGDKVADRVFRSFEKKLAREFSKR